jgi:tRNA threonylcarbamoyladenosine biosynthesis protein TsaB
MKMLAIETSSSLCSVALLNDDHVTTCDKTLPLQQAHNILPMIHDLMNSVKVHLKQLDAVAFGCGPGSFTGIRIAASVAQGLGFALYIPIISVSSLAALAQAAYHDLHWKKLWVAVDARMQEVYSGAYEVDDNGLVFLVGKEAVTPPENVLFPQGADGYGVGDAWNIYKNQLPFTPVAVDYTRAPLASGVLEIAKYKYLQKEILKPEEALPVYLRNNVAKKIL